MGAITDTVFNAAPSAAGYFYQARLALLLCLAYANKDSNVEVSIERLDDVAFEANGTPTELLQAKHHIKRTASLTDASADLWKTLRVWSEKAASDPSLPSRTRLALITTGMAPSGSVASMLRPAAAYGAGEQRQPKAAAERLATLAETSANKELKSAFAAFLDLTPPMRSSLLSAVEVVDRQPILTDLQAAIEDQLRLFAPKGKASLARDIIEGWWLSRICQTLVMDKTGAISVAELEIKLDEAREVLKREGLSVEFADAEPSQADLDSLEGFRFMKQLKAIDISPARSQWAKRDYFRAFTQRSKWTREKAVYDGELSKFEARLIEEWQPHFQNMYEANVEAPSNCDTLKKAGQKVYQWVETDARFPFRTISDRFLTVGSYHILANDLRVGWHRDYAKIVGQDQ